MGCITRRLSGATSRRRRVVGDRLGAARPPSLLVRRRRQRVGRRPDRAARRRQRFRSDELGDRGFESGMNRVTRLGRGLVALWLLPLSAKAQDTTTLAGRLDKSTYA